MKLSCWVTELARENPSYKVEGFDISPALYPAREFLPDNLSLHTIDIFGEIPDDLVGRFDIVHLRQLLLVVKDGNPSALLKAMARLLSNLHTDLLH